MNSVQSSGRESIAQAACSENLLLGIPCHAGHNGMFICRWMLPRKWEDRDCFLGSVVSALPQFRSP